MSSTFAYYFSPDGKHIEGPLSLGDIRRRLGEGTTHRARSQAMIVSQGMRDWIPADCMPGLFPVVERLGWRPPALPGAKGEAGQDGRSHRLDREHPRNDDASAASSPAATTETVTLNEAAQPKVDAVPEPAAAAVVPAATILDAMTIDYEGDDIVDAVVLEYESNVVELNKGDLDEITIDLEDEEETADITNGRGH